MFIIPVGDRVDWKRPPLITLLLILLNCLVFFVLQAGNEQQDTKAQDYYFVSGLPELELPRYAEFLQKNASTEQVQAFGAMLASRNQQVLGWMENDAPFMRALRGGQVITLQAVEYENWSAWRKKYEAMHSFTERYVYRVDTPSLLTTFTSAFMHGGFDHLLGNMLVLFMVGFLVEAVIGRSLFLLAYLVSAYTAVYVFSWTAQGGSLLGASGAIAGVMGLYTIIFGLRKIDFFYSLGFYFDYVRAPAIILLPLWLGNEVYQHFFSHGSRVAYMAHFGGLLGGALMGVLYRWSKPAMINSHHDAVEAKDSEEQDFQRGMAYLGAMEFDKALPLFKSLQEKYPQETKFATLVYRAAKLNPASENYHRAALTLLSMPVKDAIAYAQLHEVFHDYFKRAKPAPRLNVDLVAKLAKNFADAGQCEDAERLLNFMRSQAPAHNELPAVLLAVARGYFRAQQQEKFSSLLHTLMQQFPQSKEAGVAANMLRVV